MALRIDRVDTEIEILRQDAGMAEPGIGSNGGGGSDTLATVRGRAEWREKLRPIVREILNDEFNRIKRKVGAP
jgi:hypothetical protein